VHSTVTVQDESAIHGTTRAGHPQEAPAAHPVWKTSILFTLVTAVILGIVYPLVIAGLGAVLFHRQANGSLVVINGQTVGSSLIAQSFTSDRYFHPRPSAAGNGYDATSSGGSNLAQSNAKLAQRMQPDIDKLAATNPGHPVPVDAVTTSGSGLDPDITPDNAYFQVARIAAARGIPADRLRDLVAHHIQGRSLGFLGEPRVNVLELNLALDQITKQSLANRLSKPLLSGTSQTN
jgi:potassium-transporting ATPase KdpC subunit